jgi:hypothetical protein
MPASLQKTSALVELFKPHTCCDSWLTNTNITATIFKSLRNLILGVYWSKFNRIFCLCYSYLFPLFPQSTFSLLDSLNGEAVLDWHYCGVLEILLEFKCSYNCCWSMVHLSRQCNKKKCWAFLCFFSSPFPSSVGKRFLFKL